MSTIVTRAGKGSALTHTEVDANFTNLNTDKVEAAQSVTLTNKTIALGSNTVSGTTAQFNTALTDGDFATLAGSETLTNKTISGSSNTLSNIGNSSLTNSSVTIGSTSVSLGSTATTVSGLTLSSPTVNTPTLSGGTINNASVGATTPSSGAFTTLSATGVTTVQAGTAAAPAITFSGDTNTGIYSPGADQVAIATGGTKRFEVDAAGNAGLGVTPSAWSTSFGQKAFQFGPAGSLMSLQAATNNNQTFVSSNAVNLSGGWTYMYADLASQYRQYAGTHAWFTASSGTAGNPITFTQAMTLDASGNLGLGTTSLTNSAGYSTISVSGSTGGQIAFQSGGVSKHFIYGTSTDLNIYNSVSGVLGFWTNATERARIDSSGNFLVGGTSLNESFSGVPTIQGSTNCIFTNKRNTTSSASQFRFYNPNGQVGDISTSGSATTYGTSSDYRLKENVQPMSNALAKVAELKPVTYKWKVDGSDGQGFIAHELQSVCPDAVIGEKDAVQTYTDEDGNEQTRPVYQSIDTSFLVATLTAAIQELNAKVEALEAQLKGNA